jgi:hypothetical protein
MKFLLAPLAILALAWAAAAVWFDGPSSRALAGALAAGLGLGGLVLFVRLRPVWKALAAVVLLVVAVSVWWLRIPPSNDREWQPDVARPAEAHFDGNRVTIENVRNFHYRTETDFDEIWETREYDLDRLTGVDLFFSFWGPTLIAHTVVSWEFENAPPLAISIETRKEVGEAYSAVLGFFRQFELYYVVADERDVIGVRTNHRGEHVYLYRIRMPVEEARALLVDYLETIEHLAHHARWYNALTHNCTTTIRQHTSHVGAEGALDWRILVNGRLEELLYERGRIDNSLPFSELRERSEVTERAKAAGTASDFSRQIRVGIPTPEPSVARRESSGDLAAEP